MAKKAVDIALQSPRNKLTFEFQGGEPLLNFEIIKYIIEYTDLKNIELNKVIHYTMVTNTHAMTDEKINYLISKKVGLCFSLDGPQYVHDYNRPSSNNKSNFNEVKKWILYCKEKNVNVGLLPTITKESLKHPKEIIDTYIALGARGISLRELSPFGRADSNFLKIGYTANDFIEFYKKTLDYILEQNIKGINFKESNTYMFLLLLLTKQSLIYPDHKSPCGASIGQIAYNWDGNIYTCDEGRMISNTGDYTFKTGNVFNSSYEDCLNSEATINTISSSCIDCHYLCKDCVFNPICGICPVYNYKMNGSLLGNTIKNDRCKILKGIYTHIILMLEKNDLKSKLLKGWIHGD